MPPSGFTFDHTANLETFFMSCVEDLIRENSGKRDPLAAVAAEIAKIDADLKTSQRTALQTATLQQVRAFYALLHDKMTACCEDESKIGDAEVAMCVAATLSDASREIEAIKIDEGGPSLRPGQGFARSLGMRGGNL
jgi:hypothetical protein